MVLLQKICDYFGKAVTINSAYRKVAHNKKVGGGKSQHLLGAAADIVVSGVAPLTVAQHAESLSTGGIGLYGNFTHVDTRAGKVRWDQRSGKEVAVTGFGGTVPVEKEAEEMTAAEQTSKLRVTGPQYVNIKVGNRSLSIESYLIDDRNKVDLREFVAALGGTVEWSQAEGISIKL